MGYRSRGWSIFKAGCIQGVLSDGICLYLWLCAWFHQNTRLQAHCNVAEETAQGLSNNANLGNFLTLYNDNLVKVTADYAIPIYIGDVTLGGNWLAIKRLVTYPHFDYTFVGKEGLWSAGLDLTADLHAIVTLEWPCSVGVTFSWNGGSAWDRLTNNGISMDKWYLGPIFNVTF